jgi:hypothetical protein
MLRAYAAAYRHLATRPSDRIGVYLEGTDGRLVEVVTSREAVERLRQDLFAWVVGHVERELRSRLKRGRRR